jgi:hypothetical protein
MEDFQRDPEAQVEAVHAGQPGACAVEGDGQ